MPSDEQLREMLTKEEYHCMREAGIEDPYTGDYLTGRSPAGVFVCTLCKHPLFNTAAQFNSMTGWPSFDATLDGAVEEYDSTWFDKPARGVRCVECKSHLGHVFDDGQTELGKRYSINSVGIKYSKPTPQAEA